MNTSSDARNPVEALAEEFLDRKRRGEHPTLREYVERYPELAAEIRDLFPALLMMENLGESSGGTTGSLAADNGAAQGVRLDRLGDYRILREIGRGGMGVVYEAEQESLGRRVALKVLSASSLLDPKQVRRFEREARAAAKLHHTNIVPVFGVGRQDGQHYFVMQFIAGLGLNVVLDDLRRLRGGKSEAKPAPAASRVAGLTGADIARSLINGQFAGSGPIPLGETVTDAIARETGAAPPPVAPENESRVDSSLVALPGSSGLSASSDPDRQFYRSVARVGVQVAEALEYANRQGILHRDIKPSNLLLDSRGNVWVADFGLAKTAEADDLTDTGDVLGTIRYMAPERFQGNCDARSDVYSLGLTLYELVALRPAYEAPDRHALIDRVLHEEPERLKRLAPGVPRDLETIIAKASAREPAGRYATAAALAEDLKRFVEDRPIRARRVSSAERLARWCRRNKGLAASLAGTATALVAAIVVSLLYADRQARHATELTAALSESNRRVAMLDLERGRIAFEKGQIGVGMLWTVESLRMATEARAEDWKRVALANLSAWRRELAELKGVFPHASEVWSVAFSPDGKTILTGCKGMTARLWDVATGRPIGPPLEHRDWVFAVAFSPDGKTVLTGSRDMTARLWDAVTGLPLGPPLSHSGEVWSVAFSPDGKTILTGCKDKTARLWDTASGRSVGHALEHPGGVECVAFSPDGKIILTGCVDGIARLWDAASGQPVRQPIKHSPMVNSDFTGRVYPVALSPDGKTILTGGYDDKKARLWDASGQAVGQPMAHSAQVNSAAFSPDGKLILTGSADNTAQLWDAATGQRIGRAFEHQAPVNSVAFSPDSRSILTGSQDGMARLWDGDVGRPVGQLLDYGNDGLQSVAFSHGGKALFAAGWDGRVRVWDVASGQLVGQPVKLGYHIFGIAVSPDGKKILTGGDGGIAQQWDSATGRPVGHALKHAAQVSVAFSPDGKMILTGCKDFTARLWDAATGLPIGPPLEHREWVISVAFSPDGKTVLTGSRDGTARLWDAATGRPIGWPMPHRNTVEAVAFSPDGKTVLTGSLDRTARLWDAATGEPKGQPLVSSWPVWSVAFSPDGKTVLTGSEDHTAQLWDAATRQPIGAPMPHPSVRGRGGLRVACSPDGRFLLTHDMSTIRLWDVPAPLPDDLPRLAAWVEAATGLELDEQGSIRTLDCDAWQERRRRLDQLGGPPRDDGPLRLDPILFGADPTARGEALAARGLWEQAEAAYAEAARARPLNQWVWLALARFHVERGHLDRAVATVAEAVRLIPDEPQLLGRLGLALLWSHDRAGWQRSTVALLDRWGGTTDPWTANVVAAACAIGPEATADPGVPVRLAEIGVRGADELDKPDCLNTLGAALFRAGRFEQAIGRLDEGIRLRGGVSEPGDWAFLAMAHHRLGHCTEARRWLERLREHQPSADPSEFWDELEIRLLRSEAEAVILHDPVFPADPFAK